MKAGRMRLRPILMTTFALIAGMLPVALALGPDGKFYQPLAVAIIGGTITSTFLTLLVVPTFYDSIEFARERMGRKFRARSERWTMVPAFLATFVEAILTLTFIRLIWRSLVRGFRFATGRRPVAKLPPATKPVVKMTEGV
jgi:HAE1 family hydrophobic/amphiphilic exporter-1